MSNEWKFGNWSAASWDQLSPGKHILLGIEQWKFREHSRFQEVAIARVPGHGDALFLDALVQLTELDEFIYHENFALLPLLFHDRPRRVLIHGGGDGCALREVLRDPRVEQTVMVEFDELVVQGCKEHLPQLHRGSFDNSRAEIHIQDILDYLSGDPGSFDVQLVDLIDAYDAGSLELYEKVLPLIKKTMAPGALLSFFGDLEEFRFRPLYRRLLDNFNHVAVHHAHIPSFDSAYAFALVSDERDPRDVPARLLREHARALSDSPRALALDTFPAVFQLPPYLEAGLRGQADGPLSFPANSATWWFPVDRP